MSTLPPIAPAVPSVVSGWHVADEGYAQPTTAGGGYVELLDGGVVAVAYETQDAEQEMGLDAFLVTRVPVEVLRAVVDCHDAVGAPPATLVQLHRAAREIERGLDVAIEKNAPADIAEIATALTSMALAARQIARRAGR